MSAFKERYLVDENGTRLGVLLDVKDYQRILEELEELELILIIIFKTLIRDHYVLVGTKGSKPNSSTGITNSLNFPS